MFGRGERILGMTGHPAGWIGAGPSGGARGGTVRAGRDMFGQGERVLGMTGQPAGWIGAGLNDGARGGTARAGRDAFGQGERIFGMPGSLLGGSVRDPVVVHVVRRRGRGEMRSVKESEFRA